MPRDWSEPFEDGWAIDRTVECGLPGHKATFNLGHGWGPEGSKPKESSAAHFFGFREFVDPEIVRQYQQHPTANISLERWPSKRERYLAACKRLEEVVKFDPERAKKTLDRLSQEPLAEVEHPEYVWQMSASQCLWDVTGASWMAEEGVADPDFFEIWRAAIGKLSVDFPALVVEAKEKERLAKAHRVVFIPSRDGSPMAFVEGRVSFPERQGVRPKVGEEWYVEIAGQNPKGTVSFLRLVKKVG